MPDSFGVRPHSPPSIIELMAITAVAKEATVGDSIFLSIFSCRNFLFTQISNDLEFAGFAGIEIADLDTHERPKNR